MNSEALAIVLCFLGQIVRRNSFALLALAPFLINASAHAFVRSIRFDPGYVYQKDYNLGKGAPLDQTRVIAELISNWKKSRINRVYILTNNPVYGAYFQSKSVPNQPSEKTLGATKFIELLIREAAKRGIESYGWVYLLQSKGAWDANLDWRFHCSSGQSVANSTQPGLYLLDIANVKARDWYSNVIYETFDAFPGLKGIDLAEPMTANYCAGDDQTARSQVMADYIKWLAEQIKQRKKYVVLTPHVSMHADGTLWSDEELKRIAGFDLKRIVKEVPIEAIYPQLLFQDLRPQNTFPPEWTAGALKAFRKRIGEKVRLGIHLELGSNFQNPEAPPLSFDEISRAVKAARTEPHLIGIDFYSADLARKLPNLP